MCKVTKENMKDVLCNAVIVGGMLIMGGVMYHIGASTTAKEVILRLQIMALENKDTVFISDDEFNYIVNAVPKGIAD